MLKFYLERDLEKADEYYDKCVEMAAGQLATAEDIEPAWKAHLMEAKRLAEENKGGNEPSTGVRDLLGSFVDALGSINVPENGGDGEGDDETEGEGEDAAGTEG